MSKQSRAPISDFSSKALARARRSRRRRSKSMRFSQSTAIVPCVGSAIGTSLSALSFSILMSSASAHPFRGLEYRLFRGHGDVLEWRREGNGHVHCAHALHRSIEVIKSAFGDHGSDFRGNAVAFVAFIDDDGPRGFLHRLNQCFFVEWPGGARVNDLAADAAFFEHCRRTQSHLHHTAGGHDGDVAAHALDVGNSQANRIVSLGYRTFQL